VSGDSAIALLHEIVPVWAARTPDRTALVERARRWSWRELDEAIGKATGWLKESGVRPGDRVMLVCENCVAAVAVFFACNVLGAWPIVVNARLSDREIDDIRDHSGARCVVLTVAASPRAKSQAERLGATISDPAGFGPIALTAPNETAAPEPLDENPANRVAALIYTTGTTGRAKGVMLTHTNLLFVAQATAAARQLFDRDQMYAVLPMSHILGLTGVLLGSLLVGASVHLVSRFDPALTLNALQRDGVTAMIGTPSMYALIAEYAGRKGLAKIAAPALRLISSAGAPLDDATKALAEKTFGRTLHNGYGITECGPSISLTPLDAPRTDCAVGRVLSGIEVRIADTDGRARAQGETGELFVRSPGVMKGYYKSPEETAAAVDADGWFRTGDLARLENGNLFIVGRAKEMIIRHGFNVYPAEIEGVLNANPAIARSAVIGRKAGASEDVLAFVQLMDGSVATPEAISDYASSMLAPYKRPSRIVVLPSLPMSPTGKVLKNELAALA
jgi:long-chain acyl-CoA synthetase